MLAGGCFIDLSSVVKRLGNLNLAVEEGDAAGGGSSLGSGSCGLAVTGGSRGRGCGLSADAAGGQSDDHGQRQHESKKLFHTFSSLCLNFRKGANSPSGFFDSNILRI